MSAATMRLTGHKQHREPQASSRQELKCKAREASPSTSICQHQCQQEENDGTDDGDELAPNVVGGQQPNELLLVRLGLLRSTATQAEHEDEEFEEEKVILSRWPQRRQVSIAKDGGQRECQDENATPTKKVKRRRRSRRRAKREEALGVGGRGRRGGGGAKSSAVVKRAETPKELAATKRRMTPIWLILVLCLSLPLVASAAGAAHNSSAGSSAVSVGLPQQPEMSNRTKTTTTMTSPASLRRHQRHEQASESGSSSGSTGVYSPPTADYESSDSSLARLDGDEELGLEPNSALQKTNESLMRRPQQTTTSSWLDESPFGARRPSPNSSSLQPATPTDKDSLFAWFFSNFDKQWQVVLLIVIAGILNLVTIIGNIMVLISFKMDRSLQTVSNYFLLSLALADLLIGLISMPLYTLYLLLGHWPLGPLMCDLWLAIDYLNSNAAVLNMLIISFDRYFSVTRPLTYRAKRTTKHACLMISGAWIFSLTIWPPAIFLYPIYTGERKVQGTEKKCEIEFVNRNSYMTVVTALLAFYIPVLIMIYLYWRIWLETKKRYRDLTTLFLVSGVGAAAPARSTRPPLQHQQPAAGGQATPSCVGAVSGQVAVVGGCAPLTAGSARCSHHLIPPPKALMAPPKRPLNSSSPSSPSARHKQRATVVSICGRQQRQQPRPQSQLSTSQASSRLSVASPSISDNNSSNSAKQRSATSASGDQQVRPAEGAESKRTGNPSEPSCSLSTWPANGGGSTATGDAATAGRHQTAKCKCPWCPHSAKCTSGSQKVKKSIKSGSAPAGGLLSRCPKSCSGFFYKPDCSRCQLVFDSERLACKACQSMCPSCLALSAKQCVASRGCCPKTCKLSHSESLAPKESAGASSNNKEQHQQANDAAPANASSSEPRKRPSGRHHHGHHHHHHGQHQRSSSAAPKHLHCAVAGAGAGACRASSAKHHSGHHHHHHHHHHHQKQQQQHGRHADCIPSCPAGKQGLTAAANGSEQANGYIDKQSKLSVLTSSCQHLLAGNTKSLSCASTMRKVHPAVQSSPASGGRRGDQEAASASASAASRAADTAASSANPGTVTTQLFMDMSQDGSGQVGRNVAKPCDEEQAAGAADHDKCTSASCGSLQCEDADCKPAAPCASAALIGGQKHDQVVTTTTSAKPSAVIMVDCATSPIQFPAARGPSSSSPWPMYIANESCNDLNSNSDENEDHEDSERDYETRIVCNSGLDGLRFESDDPSLSSVAKSRQRNQTGEQGAAAANLAPTKRPTGNHANCKRCQWRPCKLTGASRNRCCSEAVVAHDADCRICNPRQAPVITEASGDVNNDHLHQHSSSRQACPECSQCLTARNRSEAATKPSKWSAPDYLLASGNATNANANKQDLEANLVREEAAAENENEEGDLNSRLPILKVLRKCQRDKDAAYQVNSSSFVGGASSEALISNQCSIASCASSGNNSSKHQQRDRAKKFSQKLTFSGILVEKGGGARSRADSHAAPVEQGGINSKSQKGTGSRFNIRFSRSSISGSTTGDEYGANDPTGVGHRSSSNARSTITTTNNSVQVRNNLDRIERIFCTAERSQQQQLYSGQQSRAKSVASAGFGSTGSSISGQVSGSGKQGGFLRAICCASGSPRTKRFSSNDSSSQKNSSSDDSETGVGQTRIQWHQSNSSNNSNNNNAGRTPSKPPYSSSYHPIQPKSERKAAKTLSTLLLVFIVTWLPYNVLVLIKGLSEDAVPEMIWNFSYYLCYINSTINPLCYALCNAQFRRTYMRILKCKLSNKHNSTRRLVPLQSSNLWNKADLRITSDASSNLATMTSANTTSTNNNNGYNSRSR